MLDAVCKYLPSPVDKEVLKDSSWCRFIRRRSN
jgi:hypothetical protein